MPTTLVKLPCGIIHTAQFASYLQALHAAEAARHPHHLLALDYIRCASGPQKGAAWWQMAWMPLDQAPSANRVLIDGIPVFINRQSLRGLRHRCLHHDGTRVIVKT